MDSKQKSFFISTLRRSTFRWKPRNNVLKAARVAYGKYKCASCGEIVRAKDKVLDHIDPAVDPEKGWQGADSLVERMLPYEEGWQVLCILCHTIKTEKENNIRKTKKALDKKSRKK